MTTTHTPENKSRQGPAWLDTALYPFEPHYFEVPAGTMHYIDEGTGDPVVFVHGNCGWSFEFRNVIKGISSTYRCIAPDHIGFGLSDKPADWDYLPEQHAAHLELLLNSLNLNNITLVVNDWGGPIGLSYALNHADKIKKLVILNSWMWSVKHDPYYRRFSKMMGGFPGAFLTKYFNFFAKAVIPRVMGSRRQIPRKVYRQYRKHLSKPSERKGSYVFPREIIGSSAWLDSLWKKRYLISQKPTSFVWGMKDIAFRESELNYWLDHWGPSTVIKIPFAGHYPQEEIPEMVVVELLNP